MSFGVARANLTLLGALALAAFMPWACSPTPAGAADAHLAKAKSQAYEGADVFARDCAGCHGQRGEGRGDAPSIMGAWALPVFPDDQSKTADPSLTDPQQLEEEARARPAGAPSRDPFRTAQDLFAFISKRMPLPQNRTGSLRSDEYWAIVNFMLIAHGSAVPQGGINEANAGSVSIEPP